MKTADRTKITYGNYFLEHEMYATERYNLTKIGITQEHRFTKAENVGKEKEEIIAHGVTLERGLFLIIQDMMAEKQMDYTLKEYIEEWKRERQALTNALSGINESDN